MPFKKNSENLIVSAPPTVFSWVPRNSSSAKGMAGPSWRNRKVSSSQGTEDTLPKSTWGKLWLISSLEAQCQLNSFNRRWLWTMPGKQPCFERTWKGVFMPFQTESELQHRAERRFYGLVRGRGQAGLTQLLWAFWSGRRGNGWGSGPNSGWSMSSTSMMASLSSWRIFTYC